MGVVNRSRGTVGEDFSDLFVDHYADAVRVAWLMCGDRDRAEDAAAEAMANVYLRWRRGQVQEIGPYLHRAVVNQVRRTGRRRQVERRLLDGRQGNTREPPDLPSQVADREELLTALMQLPERQRATVVLRFFADLSVDHTAEALGVSAGTVKSQTSKALAHLRGRLEQDHQQGRR